MRLSSILSVPLVAIDILEITFNFVYSCASTLLSLYSVFCCLLVDKSSALSGAAAGVTAKLCVYPFDTCKKRLQVVGFNGRKGFGINRSYQGIVDFLRVSVREEGLRGLYKGAGWALLKSGLTTSMYFLFYEKMCVLMRAYDDGDNTL